MVPADVLKTLEHSQRAGGQYDEDPAVYKVFLVGEAEAVSAAVGAELPAASACRGW